jgi:hypothetical protein
MRQTHGHSLPHLVGEDQELLSKTIPSSLLIQTDQKVSINLNGSIGGIEHDESSQGKSYVDIFELVQLGEGGYKRRVALNQDVVNTFLEELRKRNTQFTEAAVESSSVVAPRESASVQRSTEDGSRRGAMREDEINRFLEDLRIKSLGGTGSSVSVGLKETKVSKVYDFRELIQGAGFNQGSLFPIMRAPSKMVPVHSQVSINANSSIAEENQEVANALELHPKDLAVCFIRKFSASIRLSEYPFL